jgi:hypothetical protein
MKNEEIFNGLENLKIINQIILADIIEEKNLEIIKVKYISYIFVKFYSFLISTCK